MQNRDGRADSRDAEQSTKTDDNGACGAQGSDSTGCDVVGCVLTAMHVGAHEFDVTEMARTGAAALLESLRQDPAIDAEFRLALAGEPAASVLRRMASGLDEAAATLRTIAKDLAAGLALWDCDCHESGSVGGVCVKCGGKKGGL